MVIKRDDFIRWFSELSKKDVGLVGWKGAGLGEMCAHKFPVPPGFVVTAKAYKYFIEKAGIRNDIKRILGDLNSENSKEIRKACDKISDLILGSKMPDDLRDEILEAYGVLDDNDIKGASLGASDILRTSHEKPFVAVRSSIVGDLEKDSFAGLTDSWLNVKGQDSLIKRIKECFASMFNENVVFYKERKGLDRQKNSIGVVVQKMIDAQKSGVVFSKNPVFNDKSVVIESAWGLGSGISDGAVLADYYSLNPISDFELIEGRIADKKVAFARDSSGNVREVKLTDKSKQRVLNQYELKRLSQFALELEEHFRTPVNMEFAIENEGFYILQVSPVANDINDVFSETGGNVLFSGMAGAYGIKSGAIKLVNNQEDIEKVKRGDILVLDKLRNLDSRIGKAGGIITNLGGMASNPAIICRELGIPLVTGARIATEKLRDGDVVSLDGFSGRVIEGRVEERKLDIKPILSTKTKIKVNIDIPEYSSKAADSGAKHVGIIRVDDLISDSGMHSLSYLKKDKLDEYIGLIHTGLKKVSLPFDEIWIKTSDSRSEEFRNLEGSPKLVESNPLLGYRGIRFGLKNQDLLDADFRAIKEIADEFPRKKFGVMLPHVISTGEVKIAKKIFQSSGIPKNVLLGIVVETPAAVHIIEDLCEDVDFVNLDIDNLAQYILTVDKNNSEVQDLYDEMHPAVLKSIKKVIDVCKKKGVESCASGSAVLQNDITKFLVNRGIDGISVDAGNASGVSEIVKSAEIELNRGVDKVENRDVDEESLILNALEEENESKDSGVIPIDDLDFKNEYKPGFEKEDGIPKLNDAIPVGSRDFEDKKEDVIPFDKLDDVGKEEDKDMGDSKDYNIGESIDKIGETKCNEERVLDNVENKVGEADKAVDKEEVIGELEKVEDIADAVFEAEVIQEVQESEVREKAKKEAEQQGKEQQGNGQVQETKKEEVEGKEQEKEPTEFLDIF